MAGPATAFQVGDHSSRPSNGAGCVLYSCTDHGLVYLDNGSSWSTLITLTSGMSNPMTTAGDIVYSSDGSGTPARLAAGTDGYVLTLASGLPSWAAGGGGDVATDAIWDAAGDLAVGTGANTAAKLTAGSNGQMLRLASGTPAWASEAGRLLAYKSNNTGGVYSTSSATLADVDATNMVVSFTVPSTGNVLIRLTAMVDTTVGTAGQYLHWGLRESTTNIGTSQAVTRAPNVNGRLGVAVIPVTGLTPGDAKTYKWSHAMTQASAATGRTYAGAGGGDQPFATMEVWAAP